MQQEGSQHGFSPEFASYAGSQNQGQMLDKSQQQHQLLTASAVMAEAAPPPQFHHSELTPTREGFPGDEAVEEAERGATAGNRWPRQETLALLSIRSEMDATFKEAILKGPLWEEVSRRLSELGYSRSAKKCREKFENVQKYYKRTKESRAGRQDGRCYRFFRQLEALHGTNGHGGASEAAATSSCAATAAPLSAVGTKSVQMLDSSSRLISPFLTGNVFTPAGGSGSGKAIAGAGFSPSASSSSESEDEMRERGEGVDARKKRRTESGSELGKMLAFFERLMKEVMEKQEQMLQRFLETMEKREQDRMIREEAWRRQEMDRLARKHELMAQERADSASRDAALISCLQRFTGQIFQVVAMPTPPQPPRPPPPPPDIQPPPPQPLALQQKQQQGENQSHFAEAVGRQQGHSSDLVEIPQEQLDMTRGRLDPASSRWPKEEVLALIQLRSEMELSYQESSPKGPLWEDISKRMQHLGFNRSAKRCKEKWENINKYFKKVKESKKERPDDAKTCPYFHQLEALYGKKLLPRSSGGSETTCCSEQEQDPPANDSGFRPQESTGHALSILPLSQLQAAAESGKNGNSGNAGKSAGFVDLLQVQFDGDNDEEEEEEKDEDNESSPEENKVAYKIQYQRPSPDPSSGQENQSTSFLTMVQ